MTPFLVNSKAYKLLQANAKANFIPLSVLLEMTHACNFDCIHCYNPAVKKGVPLLSLREYEALFEEFRKMGTFLLTFSGGEPFVRRDFLAIVDVAARQNFCYRIYTNGSLISEKKLEELNKAGLIGFEMSLYGASPEVCDPIMGKKGAYDDIVRASRLLRSWGISLILKATILRGNYKDIIEMWRLAHDLGAEFKYSPWVTLAEETGLDNLQHRLTPEMLEEFYHLLGEMQMLAMKESGANEAAQPLSTPQGPVEASCDASDDFLCGAGITSCQIDPYGNVFPCVEIWESAGNIREESIQTLWRDGSVFKEMRGLRKKHIEAPEDGCGTNSCSSFHCAGISKNETGSFTNPNPIALGLEPNEKRFQEGHYAPSFNLEG